MIVFVTGATGYIGTAVVTELLQAGHRVVGLSRSEKGARMLTEAGAQVRRGDLDDLEALRSGAAAADGIIHLAFKHDVIMSDLAAALKADLLAVQALGSAIEGSGKPFLVTNHTNGEASEMAALGLKGVRAIAVSLSPSVHGEGDKGFVPTLIGVARTKGFSAYVGDGSNRWPAVHRLDAANLYRLALEKAPNGSRLSGRGDEGVPFRDIAGVIARKLGLPVRSIPPEEAEAHFGFLGRLAGTDIPAVLPGSNEETRKLLGWRPVHPGLIADLEEGHYFQ